MTITYTLPSINTPHGGYRIVLEHLSRLQRKGHDVSLFIEGGVANHDWYGDQFCPITRSPHVLRKSEVVVIGSPHSMWYQRVFGQRVVSFVQMAEHLFRPGDNKWLVKCMEWYNSPYTKMYGSHWIGELLKGESYYIADGINTDHFPVQHVNKSNDTVLIEGWECSNPAKDTEAIACKVAERLKAKGVTVLAYGFQPLKRYSHVPDEYHYRPSIEVMNNLYRRADVLIKASKYDSRALSPTEAMTKGCVTARALINGDDNLVNGHNCYRCGYNEDELYEYAERLLNNPDIRSKMIGNFAIPEWQPIINQLEEILCS